MNHHPKLSHVAYQGSFQAALLLYILAIKTYFVLGRKDGRTSTAQSPKLSDLTTTGAKNNELTAEVQIVVDAPTDDEPVSSIKY